MSWDKESDLKHKYTYVDGEQDVAYKKKKRKPAPKKANHKHEYTNIIIEYTYPKNYPVTHLAGKPAKALESYCTVCGKLSSPQKDDIAAQLFPHIYTGHFGFISSIRGYEQENNDYREWADKHYPHYSMPDYYEAAYRGQTFLDLDKIIPPVLQ